MFKKAFAVMSSAALCAALMSAVPVSAALDNSSKTAQEIVNDMGIGINLGNTFEACGDWIKGKSVSDYEKAWGSVEITKDIIDGYAKEGFKTLRIPVAWSNMMDDDYTIAPEYIERVKQVAQWAVDADMYVIVNEHWDSGWINYYPDNKEEVMKHYKSIWNQVSDAFKDFDDHLILESQNEELGAWKVGNDEWFWNRWGSDTTNKQAAYDYALDFNQAFVDIVRNSGGNNDDRLLLISGICTDIDATTDPAFKMPEDPAGKMAVSVHYYTPFNYALSDNSKSWGTIEEYAELNSYMQKLTDTFVSKGTPVIIGEACVGFEISKKAENTAREYIDATCREAYERGMCPVIWDITYNVPNGEPRENQVYDRRAQEMVDQQLKADLADIVADGHKKDNVITVGNTTFEYGADSYELDIKATGGDVKFQFLDGEGVIEFTDGLKFKALKSGEAEIMAYVSGDAEYAETFKKFTVTIDKGTIAVRPEENITVSGDKYKTNEDVELPEGWVWDETVELVDGEAVVARAKYTDSSYKSNTMNINITWTKGDDSSDTDSSSKSSSTSKADAGTNDNKTTNTASTTNAATGASAASAFAVTALVAAAAIMVKKKNR